MARRRDCREAVWPANGMVVDTAPVPFLEPTIMEPTMPPVHRQATGPGPRKGRGAMGGLLPPAALLGLALLLLAGCGGGRPSLPDMPEYAAGRTYLLQQETLRRHAAAVRAKKERLALQHARQRAAERAVLWEKLRRVLENPAYRLDHDGA